MSGQPLNLDGWLALVRERPLLVADLETTDTDAATCGIVEVGLACYDEACVQRAIDARQPTGELEYPTPAWEHALRVNPGVPIQPGAQAVHGISDADVAGCPGVDTLVEPLRQLAGGVTVVTYNGRKFDLPVLRRCAGFEPEHPAIDVMGLWTATKHMRDTDLDWFSEDERAAGAPISAGQVSTLPGPRQVGDPIFRLGRDAFAGSLAGAHGALVGRRMVKAHAALFDCHATARVLFALVALCKLPPWPGSLAAVANDALEFIRNGPEGPYLSRGKYEGMLIRDVFRVDEGYLGWILAADGSGDDYIEPYERARVAEAIGEASAERLYLAQQKKRRGSRRA